jgi:hypothetical protein
VDVTRNRAQSSTTDRRAARSEYPAHMPECKQCGEEVDELVAVSVEGKKKRVCESCAEDLERSAQIAEQSEAVVQNMMGFKGRR